MESLSSLGNQTNPVVMTTPSWISQIRINVSTPETPTGSCNSSTSRWELNSTEQTSSPAPPPHHNGLAPVFGYPGPIFTAIHVSALISLSLSEVIAIILFIYLCGFSGSVKDQKRETEVNGKMAVKKKKKAQVSFWKWNVGERFVIYLNFCDLCQGTSHILDHAYMIYAKDSPPDRICGLFAFFLHNFILSQWMVVAASALSACILIVFGRKMSLGRYDWRLFAFSFGIPVLVSVIATSLGLLGASGAWCYIKYGTPSSAIYTQIVSAFQIALYGLIGLAYGAIWIKIQRTTQLMKGSTTERYQNSAKVMMIFVAVFIFQWWSLTLFNVWGLIVPPPAVLAVLPVIFVNLGGVYNSIAYTVIRRRLQGQKRQNAVASKNDNITNSTAAKSSGAPPRTVSVPRAVNVPDGSRVPEVLDIPPKVLNDPDVVSQVTQAGNVPIVSDASQNARMAGDGQHGDSESGEPQDVGPIHIHIHI